MAYKLQDRAKEWTSWIGAIGAGLAVAIPMVVPADTHWVQAWQGIQMLVGVALVFIPQTAGSTAVENDSWQLLRAFAAKAPPEYAAAMRPLLATLAGHLAEAEATPAAAPAPLFPKPVGIVSIEPNHILVTPAELAPAPAAAVGPVGPPPNQDSGGKAPVAPTYTVSTVPLATTAPALDLTKFAVTPVSAPLVADPASALRKFG